MKNPLEKPDLSKIEGEDLEVEEIVNKLEQKTEEDFSNSEVCSINLVLLEKAKLGILELDPKLEEELKNVRDRYSGEKKKLKSSFASKLKKIGKYLSGGIISLAVVGHFTQKEFPDYLSQNKEIKKIEWNESTQKEIRKLADEYASLMKSESGFEQVPDSLFQNRFIHFVEDYGPDIQIIHPDDEMSLGDKINSLIFKDILNQEESRAHYYSSTLFYEDKNLKHSKDSTSYDWSTSSLPDFIAEFSHHLNHDYGWGRSYAYVENLVKEGFQQGHMYEGVYSPEYQAHSITQNAVAEYFDPKDRNLNSNFIEIYNVRQEYYREFLNRKRSFERNQSIEALTWVLLDEKSSSEILSGKQIVFNNLEGIRDKIEGIKVGEKFKERLFEIVIATCDLYITDQDLDQIVKETKEIIQLTKTVLDPGKIDFNPDEDYVKYLLRDKKYDEDEGREHYFEKVNSERARFIKKVLDANIMIDNIFRE